MKYILILFIGLTSNLNAQTVYESPYVHDSTAVQVTFPKGYIQYKMPYSSIKNAFLTRDTSMTNLLAMDSSPSDVFMVDHQKALKGQTLAEQILDGIEEDETTTILNGPELKTVNGNNVLSLVVHIEEEDFSMETFYVAAIEHNDFVVIVGYISAEVYNSSSMNDKNFQELINSIKIAETTNENKLDSFYDIYDDEFEFFKNSMFETSLTYDDIFFDAEEDDSGWTEYWGDEFVDRYLIEYKYNTIDEGTATEHGTVRVFSAGQKSNYPTTKSKALALDTVMPKHMFRDLNKIETIKTEELVLTKYNFLVGTKAPTLVHSVYTTEFKDELVFIIVEKTHEASKSFDEISRNFVTSLWIMDVEMMLEEMEIEED